MVLPKFVKGRKGFGQSGHRECSRHFSLLFVDDVNLPKFVKEKGVGQSRHRECSRHSLCYLLSPDDVITKFVKEERVLDKVVTENIVSIKNIVAILSVICS